MQVLIVDDDRMAVAVIQNTLLQAGYEVITAGNGEEALALLRQGNCRLVVSDWLMPKMSGKELCSAVREEKVAGYIYIILLTAHDGAQQRIEGLSAGADEFLTKPFNSAELIARVRAGERILNAERMELHAEITRRRRAEESLRAYTRQQAVIARLGQRALADIALDDLMAEIVDEICKTLEVETCGILEMAPNRCTLRLRSGRGWRPSCVGSATLSAERHSPIGQVAYGFMPSIQHQNAAAAGAPLPPLLADHDIRSGVSVVIPSDGGTFGLLGAYSTRSRAFSAHELEFLSAVGNVLGLAINHRRGIGALTESELRLRQITDNLEDIFWVMSADGNQVFYVSPAYHRMWGSKSDALAHNAFAWLEAIHQEDRGCVRRLFTERAPIGKYDVEFRIVQPDGAIRWIWDRAFPIRTHSAENQQPQRLVRITEDITERKQLDDSRRRIQEELASFIENATEGLHWTNRDGVITWANRAELALLGYGRDEFVGHNISEFHADAAGCAEMLQRLSNSEELHNFSAVLRHKDGSIRHVIIDANVMWQDGRFVHTQCFTRDITERKCAEEALLANQRILERTNHDLELGNKKLSELYQTAQRFVDNVSHEFRTPLTVVKGYSEALCDGLAGPINDRQKEFLGFVVDRTRDLAQMVDDLLDTSKLRAGTLRINRAVHSVEALLKPIRPMLQAKAAGNKVELIEELPADLPQVFVDAEKTGRVIVNLVVNAIKFSSEGKRVRIWAKSTGSGVELGITDNGPGISPENLKLIFQRFRQVGNPQDGTKGFGLGLNIARELVALNLGEIQAASDVGHGSTFSFTMPVTDPRIILGNYLRYLRALPETESGMAALRIRCSLKPKDLTDFCGLLASSIRAHDLMLRARDQQSLLLMGYCTDAAAWAARLRDAAAAIRAQHGAGLDHEPQIEVLGEWPKETNDRHLINEILNSLNVEPAYA